MKNFIFCAVLASMLMLIILAPISVKYFINNGNGKLSQR